MRPAPPRGSGNALVPVIASVRCAMAVRRAAAATPISLLRQARLAELRSCRPAPRCLETIATLCRKAHASALRNSRHRRPDRRLPPDSIHGCRIDCVLRAMRRAKSSGRPSANVKGRTVIASAPPMPAANDPHRGAQDVYPRIIARHHPERGLGMQADGFWRKAAGRLRHAPTDAARREIWQGSDIHPRRRRGEKRCSPRASSSERPSRFELPQIADARCDHSRQALALRRRPPRDRAARRQEEMPGKTGAAQKPHGFRAIPCEASAGKRPERAKCPSGSWPKSTSSAAEVKRRSCARKAKKGARSSVRAPASRRSAMRSRSMSASAASRSRGASIVTPKPRAEGAGETVSVSASAPPSRSARAMRLAVSGSG